MLDRIQVGVHGRGVHCGPHARGPVPPGLAREAGGTGPRAWGPQWTPLPWDPPPESYQAYMGQRSRWCADWLMAKLPAMGEITKFLRHSTFREWLDANMWFTPRAPQRVQLGVGTLILLSQQAPRVTTGFFMRARGAFLAESYVIPTQGHFVFDVSITKTFESCCHAYAIDRANRRHHQLLGMYTLSHRECGQFRPCMLENFDKFEMISTPTGSWIRSRLRRDRIQLPVGVEIISNFSKFSFRQGRNCPHSRWDRV